MMKRDTPPPNVSLCVFSQMSVQFGGQYQDHLFVQNPVDLSPKAWELKLPGEVVSISQSISQIFRSFTFSYLERLKSNTEGVCSDSRALRHRHTLETVQTNAPECSSHLGTLETDWLPPSQVSAHVPLHHSRGASLPPACFQQKPVISPKVCGFCCCCWVFLITKKHFLNIFHKNCLQLLNSPHTLPRVKPMPEKTFSALLCYLQLAAVQRSSQKALLPFPVAAGS